MFKESVIYPFVNQKNKSCQIWLFLPDTHYREIVYFIEEIKMGALV